MTRSIGGRARQYQPLTRGRLEARAPVSLDVQQAQSCELFDQAAESPIGPDQVWVERHWAEPDLGPGLDLGPGDAGRVMSIQGNSLWLHKPDNFFLPGAPFFPTYWDWGYGIAIAQTNPPDDQEVRCSTVTSSPTDFADLRDACQPVHLSLLARTDGLILADSTGFYVVAGWEGQISFEYGSPGEALAAIQVRVPTGASLPSATYKIASASALVPGVGSGAFSTFRFTVTGQGLGAVAAININGTDIFTLSGGTLATVLAAASIDPDEIPPGGPGGLSVFTQRVTGCGTPPPEEDWNYKIGFDDWCVQTPGFDS